MRRGAIVAVACLALLLAGCRAVPGGAVARGDAELPALAVSVEDGAVVLDDAASGDRFEIRLGAERGEILHATLRPGEHDEQTVLVLTRVRDEGHESRFELRYLTASSESGVSELLWLPWRHQVDATAASVLDVPPLPIWSPDGSTVAWIEWVDEGTRLRTIGWIGTDRTTSPAADGGAYVLDEVPAGTQLEVWHDGEDGVPVLVGRSAHDRWNIRLDPGHGSAVAMAGVRA